MENTPSYVYTIFVAVTLLTIVLFYFAANKNKLVLWLSIVWLGIQALIGLSGFYAQTNSMPPGLFFALAPVLLFIVVLTITKWGKRFLNSMHTGNLILLSIVRIPVEFVLLWLYKAGKVPETMTFEGNNLDILSGITAIVIWVLYRSNKLSATVLRVWNILCLGLLTNIVTIAVLSAPSPFQQFGLQQPNIAVLHFPFVWLPTYIVPVVLLTHVAMLRKSFTKDKNQLL